MIKATLLCPAPDYPEPIDWAYDNQAAALEQAGFRVTGRRWTDDRPEEGADIVLPLVAWGYHLRVDQWHAFLDRLEEGCVPIVNAVPLLRWNSDKSYLGALADAGVPTVPTMMAEALDENALTTARRHFETTELVIKPPVSASANATYRLGNADSLPDAVRGQKMLIQPFQRSVTTVGELSLMFFGGEFSHAIVKRPKTGDYRVQAHLGGTEQLCEPPAEAIAVAQQALAKAPLPPVYVRVDLIADQGGQWQVIELELIEPALWLPRAPGSAARFAAAVRAEAEQILAKR